MDNIKHKSLLQMLLSIPIAGVLVGIDQLILGKYQPSCKWSCLGNKWCIFIYMDPE